MDSGYRTLTEEQVLATLRENNVVTNDITRKHVKEFIEFLKSDKVSSEPFLIAEGKEVVEPVDAEFTLAEELRQKDAANDEAVVNFYSRHTVITVDAGTVIGKASMPIVGKEGADVHGKVIRPTRPPVDVRLGENVEMDPKTRLLKATSAGQVICERGKISVRGVYDISGDVCFETGNVDSATDVLVQGTVHDLFIVKSKRNISVRGLIESAYLFAGGNVTIIGGVKGREKAIIEADGDVNVKFIDSTWVRAGGLMEVARECLNANVICRGELDLRNGVIIGGHVFAVGGIRVKTLGSPANVPTTVGIACDPSELHKTFMIDEKIVQMTDVVGKIKKNVEPLMQQLKRLTAEQREKATELMYKSYEIEESIQKLQDQKVAILGAMPDPLSVAIMVSLTIFPNTEVVIGNKCYHFREEVKGPVRIELRKMEGVTEMVIVNRLSGSLRTLRAQPITADCVAFPERPHIHQPGSTDADLEKAVAK